MTAAASTYDVIVVGAGSAGSVIARRLVADGGARVLLLEAGGSDRDVADIHEPAANNRLWGTPVDWNHHTEPQAALNARRLHWPRGKVLGGSSALNGMIHVRGAPVDYDGWARAGNPGWSYREVLELFRRSEDFDRGASDHHGAGGPIHVLSDYTPHPVNEAAVQAAVEHGIPFNPDANGAEIDGAGFCQLTIAGGRRHSAYGAFVAPLVADPRLTVISGATVHRLLIERGGCRGVEYRAGGRLERATAELEVVLAAGVIGSPQLLMLSGVGDPDALTRLGIPVAAALPGVGRNLHDHVLVPVIVAARRPVPPPLAGLTVMHSQLFWRSRPGSGPPDLQPLFFHVPLYEPWMTGPDDAFTLMAGMVRPASRGTLTLAAADPTVPPRLDPRYLSEPADVDATLAAVELCRALARRPALAGWAGPELYPGSETSTRAELRAYVAATLVTYHHQVGTCRMGTDELAVVDPELRVRGVTGLRVADASVIPRVPGGNTAAPAMMIGEKAADLIRATHHLDPPTSPG